jgi:PAS domain S-box-containing protein
MGFVHMIDTAELKGAVRLHQAAILDASDDAIIFENLEGVILAWNSAAERTFGYTADEAIGRSMAIVISPEFQPTQIEDSVMLASWARQEASGRRFHPGDR